VGRCYVAGGFMTLLHNGFSGLPPFLKGGRGGFCVIVAD
jgi:hypothetical protein